ncbi:MAG: aspartate aminotransferase family protein [Actinomycetia bacterium]|nr:aspartate aminotransferase family protein [Actinomycetes bacterium]
MHTPDQALVDLVLAYVTERLALEETPIDGFGDRVEMQEALEGLISNEPKDPAEVLGIYEKYLSETVLSADSPRFFGFIPAAPTKASLLFDMVVSAASLQGCSWLEAAGAVMAENQALRTMADIAGMPQSAGGTFVSGGSAGNLSALVVARDTARAQRKAHGQPLYPLQVVVSDQAHSSIQNALNIVDMGAIVVPTADGRMTRNDLELGLAGQDLSNVVAIIATAGTTNAGIIDQLDAAADVAEKNGWWFHVDGAYGGAGMLDPEKRTMYQGIERVDSLVMDPHKWWFAPFDSAALLYQDPHLAKGVHTQDASYLDVIHTSDLTEFNPSDLAYHLTRRARGMALWFSLAVNGLDAYRDAVVAGNQMARYAAEQIKSNPNLELIHEPDLSVVLFRRQGWTAENYDKWSTDLLDQQVAFVTSSSWRGETVGRLVFLHPGTTSAMVDEVLAELN